MIGAFLLEVIDFLITFLSESSDKKKKMPFIP